MKRFLLLALCFSVLALAGSVQAESRGQGGERSEQGMGQMIKGSTTPMKKGEAMEKPEGRRAIPGIVTGVTSTGFTMSGRGQGKNKATTTLTVTVTSKTIFKIRNSDSGMKMPPRMGSTTPMASTTQPVMGTTTGSLSNIIVGSKVEVFGKVATSTNSIVADKVHINRGKGEEKRGDKMERREEGVASGTPKMMEKRGFMNKLRDFMGNTNGSTTSGGPASPGFLELLSSVFFGWFK